MRDDALTAEFEALEHAWAEALVRQDRVALELFLAPDYALVVSAAPDRPVARDAWLAQAVGSYRIEHFRIERLRARLLADGLVAVSLLFEQRANVAGVDRSGVFFLTDIWRRGTARWEVVARYSAPPEPASVSSQTVTGE
jgi:Domain of unknown function (DUF4440)